MNGELVIITEVASMTRLSEGTLRYWRSVEAGGPESFTLMSYPKTPQVRILPGARVPPQFRGSF